MQEKLIEAVTIFFNRTTIKNSFMQNYPVFKHKLI